jgi:hypothetical protein
VCCVCIFGQSVQGLFYVCCVLCVYFCVCVCMCVFEREGEVSAWIIPVDLRGGLLGMHWQWCGLIVLLGINEGH